MNNLTYPDKDFLRKMRIDPDAEPVDRERAVADAILGGVPFEDFKAVCEQRDAYYMRAVSAETSVALHKSVIHGLQDEIGRRVYFEDRLRDQNRWFAGLFCLSLIAVYVVGSFGNLW